MGEEKWTHREPGSISGSMVPPATAGDGAAPGSPSLPKRPNGSKPERVSGTAPLYLAASQQPVSAAPQVPDNVRYLFRPVLTQAAPALDFDRLDEPDGIDEPGEAGAACEPAVTAAEDKPRRANVLAAAGTHRRVDAVEPDGTIPAGIVATHRLRRNLSVAVAIIVVLATAAGTAFALVTGRPSARTARQTTAGAPGGVTGATPFAKTGAKAITGLSKAGIVRSRAAQWVMREVSRSVIIACDDVMCSQLFNAGIPASNLLVLSPSAADPLGADLVLGTPAVRSQFGSRLALVYAPSVLASFGIGKLRVDVRVVAPQGAAKYELALNRDIATRQRDGSQLLTNSGITVAAPAQPELIAGLVDPRLLSMLPVLATQHPIQIAAFYDRAPRSGRGIPLSGVELAATDSAAGLSDTAYRHWLLGFLRSQRAPFSAASITTAHLHGRAVILVRFARPSPIGLLNSAVSGGHAY